MHQFIIALKKYVCSEIAFAVVLCSFAHWYAKRDIYSREFLSTAGRERESGAT
jgi:hypothetical protein